MEGAASVVYLDGATGERMWDYLRDHSLSQIAADFGDEALPGVTRSRNAGFHASPVGIGTGWPAG